MRHLMPCPVILRSRVGREDLLCTLGVDKSKDLLRHVHIFRSGFDEGDIFITFIAFWVWLRRPIAFEGINRLITSQFVFGSVCGITFFAQCISNQCFLPQIELAECSIYCGRDLIENDLVLRHDIAVSGSSKDKRKDMLESFDDEVRLTPANMNNDCAVGC